LTLEDSQALIAGCPAVKNVTTFLQTGWMQQHTVRTKSGEVSAIDFRGVQANFGQVYANAATLSGRFISEGDDLHRGKACGENFPPACLFSRCRSSPSLMNRPESVAAFRIHLAEIRLYTRKSMALTSPGLRAHGVLLHPSSLQKCGDIFHCRTPGNQSLRIFQRQWFALPLFQRNIATVKALVPLGNKPGIRAKLLDVVLDGFVDPVISAATSIMTLTPSTTPKTVSPLRILWVRNVSIACLRFSPYACAILPSR